MPMGSAGSLRFAVPGILAMAGLVSATWRTLQKRPSVLEGTGGQAGGGGERRSGDASRGASLERAVRSSRGYRNFAMVLSQKGRRQLHED